MAIIDELFFVIRTNPDPSGTAKIFGIYESLTRADENILEFDKDPATSGLYEIAVLGSGNTLDQAYDEGGAGAGRTITADTGAVQLDTSVNTALKVNQQGNFIGVHIDKTFATGAGSALFVDSAGSSPAAFIGSTGAGTCISVTKNFGTGVAVFISQITNAIGLKLEKLLAGAGNLANFENDGIGDGLFLDQDGNGIAVNIDSEATSNPLILLQPITSNSRGDIAFGTGRTADPSSPSESDVWYNATTHNLLLFDGTSNIDLTAGGNTLDAAYDQGGAGAGRTITADTGAVQVDGSVQLAVDINQAENFGCLELDKNGTGAGIVLKINNAGTGLDIEGEGATWSVNKSGDAIFNRVSQPFQAVTATTTTTVNFASGNHVRLAMNADITTLTLSNPRDGEHYVFRLTQDATGDRTISWPATVLWPGGVAPTLGGANIVDVVSMVYDETNTEYLADFSLAFS